MIQKLRDRLTNGKKDNKGFTLVELIVVIVILAILAALLVPALVGWIDKAKNEKYAVEARNIYLATQAEISTEYAKSSTFVPTPEVSGAMKDAIEETSNLTIATIKGMSYATDGYTIIGMTIEFTSADGKNVSITLSNGSWGKATIS